MSRYQLTSEIADLVRAFETCQIDKDKFKHRDHLTVAVWYIEQFGKEAALERMRAGLLRFLEYHGVVRRKYKEVITVFWIELIADKLDAFDREVPLVDKCNEIIETLS